MSRMKKLWEWLGDMPSTNVMVVVAIILTVTFVYGTMLLGLIPLLPWTGSEAEAGEYLPPYRHFDRLADFIIIFVLIATGHFATKRITYKPSPPMPPDVEDQPDE